MNNPKMLKLDHKSALFLISKPFKHSLLLRLIPHLNINHNITKTNKSIFKY